MQGLQEQHLTTKNIEYQTLKMQEYMSDPDMNAEDISFLFALRTRTVRGIRKDFENMFPTVLCPLCNLHEDIIQNLRVC